MRTFAARRPAVYANAAERRVALGLGLPGALEGEVLEGGDRPRTWL